MSQYYFWYKEEQGEQYKSQEKERKKEKREKKKNLNPESSDWVFLQKQLVAYLEIHQIHFYWTCSISLIDLSHLNSSSY